MKRGIFGKEEKGWDCKSLIYVVIMPPRPLFFLGIDMDEVNNEKPRDKLNKSDHYGKLKRSAKFASSCYCLS